MKFVKPFIVFLLILVLLGGLSATMWLDNSNNNLENPPEDVADYDNSNADNSFNALTQKILQLQHNISVLENERNAVVQELLNSQLSNEFKEQLIYELQNNITNLQVYIVELNNMILFLQSENEVLKSKIIELEEIKASLLQTVFALEQQIILLNSEILEQRFVCTFMFDDNIYSVVLVPASGKVEIESPISTEYTIFLGWSLSLNGELIDLNEFEVNTDTIFYAKIIRKYNVNYAYENMIYSHKVIEKGQTYTVTNPVDTNRKIFKGWSLDGVNIINPATYAIWEHTTFFAVIETRYLVSFAYKRGETITNISTQYVATATAIVVPTIPTFSGYTFGGWTLNQSATTPTSITLIGDVVFFAKYTPISQSITSSSLPISQNSLNQNITYAGDFRVERVFFNLDSLIGTGTLENLTVTVKMEFPTTTRTVKVTLTSFHDTAYRAQYQSNRLDVFMYAVYHKTMAHTSSGIPAGTNVICFDTWVESSAYRIPPENCLVTITSIQYKFVDDFKY